MPDENGEIPTTTMSSQNTERRFYLGTCPGILRICICVLGLGAIILASLGSPDDLSSVDSSSPLTAQDSDFYGSGLGYASAEPLNALFLALLVISWLITLGYLVLAIFSKSGDGKGQKLNRILYAVAGAVVWIACICGAVGTFNFWGGCCHVYVPVRGETYLRYHEDQTRGYAEWCYCALRIMRAGSQRGYIETYMWRSPYLGLEILSAWPHHFIVHIISLVLSAIFGILCFMACCIA